MQSRRRHGPEFWRDHFNRWKASGLSQTQYSIGQKISAKTFSRWCGRLKRAGAVSQGGSAEAKVSKPFVPLVVTGAASTPEVTAFRAALRFRIEGTPLIAEVASGADGFLLADVLAALMRTTR